MCIKLNFDYAYYYFIIIAFSVLFSFFDRRVIIKECLNKYLLN